MTRKTCITFLALFAVLFLFTTPEFLTSSAAIQKPLTVATGVFVALPSSTVCAINVVALLTCSITVNSSYQVAYVPPASVVGCPTSPPSNKIPAAFVGGVTTKDTFVKNNAAYTKFALTITGSSHPETPIYVPVGFSGSQGWVYVADYTGDEVWIVNPCGTPSFSGPIALGSGVSGPEGTGYDSASTVNLLFVADQGSGDVSVINSANTVCQTISGFTTPRDDAYDPVSGAMLVPDGGTGDLDAIPNAACGSLTASFGVLTGFSQPLSVVWNPSNELMYMSDVSGNMVYAIKYVSGVYSIKCAISVPGAGDLAYASKTHYVYVTQSAQNEVTVIKGCSVVTTISLPASPLGIASVD